MRWASPGRGGGGSESLITHKHKENSNTTKRRRRPSSTTQQETGDKVAPPKGREGRLHHQTGETTQRGKKPSRTTQKGEENNAKDGGDQAAPPNRRRKKQQHHPKGRMKPNRCSFFPCLLLRGATWSPPSLALFSSPFEWCCLVLSFLLGGVVVFSFSCWVALLGLLLPWRCFPLLLRGAAWFLPSLGGLCCLVVLPSSPSSGQWCVSPVFCWVVLLALLLLLLVVLLFFLLLRLPLLVVLLFFLLILGGAAWSPPYNAKEGGTKQHHAKGEGTQHPSKREQRKK